MTQKGESEARMNCGIMPMSDKRGGSHPDMAACESHLAEAEMRSQKSKDGRLLDVKTASRLQTLTS